MALSAKFKDATAEGAPLPANEDWWRAFHDATLDNLQAEVEAANPDLAAAIAANAAEQARAQAALSGLFPQCRRDRPCHRQQAVEQPAAALGGPADLLRRQPDRGSGVLRGRHLGTRARYRSLRQRDGGGERGRAGPGAARTARGACARLHRSARPRRRGEALCGHDRHLSFGPGSDEVPAPGADRVAGRRRPRPDPAQQRRSARLRPRAAARGARGRDCGAGRQVGCVVYGRAVDEAPAAAWASPSRSCRRSAAAAGRRRGRAPDRRTRWRMRLRRWSAVGCVVYRRAVGEARAAAQTSARRSGRRPAARPDVAEPNA